jgi:hypothetical protein
MIPGRFPWPFVITHEDDTGKYVVFGPEGELIDVFSTREDAEDCVRDSIEIMRCPGDIE